MADLQAADGRTRCGWTQDTFMMNAYHDDEWGVPVRDDRKLFEFLVLDSFQAGLSWAIVLKKRDAFRAAFDSFDIPLVAGFADEKIQALCQDAGIIRNRQKIAAAVHNARLVLGLIEEYGGFSHYIWRWVGGKMRVNRWRSLSEIPATTPESDEMSADLKRRGFKFAGSTICYAFMQSVGMVNDHLVSCYRHDEVARLA